MILNDKQILDLCEEQRMVTPYAIRQVREIDGKKVISYGLSSFGYDARVADDFRLVLCDGVKGNNYHSNGVESLHQRFCKDAIKRGGGNGRIMEQDRISTDEWQRRTTIDPKAFDVDLTAVLDARNKDGSVTLPPHSFTLARTVEYFRIPDDVMVICLGKSTYARCGLIVNVTPLEPGWEGSVTLELSNTTPLPIKVYPNEGICQFVFFRGDRPAVSYGDRNDGKGGKYQGQRNITVARL